jgi:proline-specific peptidase
MVPHGRKRRRARQAPLAGLHGGPGASHDYLEPLEAMANSGRRVIFYDQLGGGNSDHPHNPSLWTVALFVEELGAVRKALALDHLHLLGQSWGIKPATIVGLKACSFAASADTASMLT